MHTVNPALAWVAAGLLAAMLVAVPALPARADADHLTARRLRDAGQILSLERIAERAHAEKPGEILETELKQKHGRYIYEIEILDNGGRVWELKFDARSGALIKLEKED
jgi:uncharacterized membrane protein YkoI